MKLVRAVPVLAAGVVAALLVWSWIGPGDDTRAPSEPQAAPDDAVSGTVTVLAAASLAESFSELADRLRESHPQLEIVFSFGSSTALVEQVRSGARADVLATADATSMDAAVRAGTVDGDAQVFAKNTLALVVPPGNPGGVTGLADLERDELRIALCEPQVPCGSAAADLTAAAGVRPVPDTLTTDVKQALAFVTLGEADGALVYRTDAYAAGEAVEIVRIDGAADVVNHYSVALLEQAPAREAAAVVVEAISGELGASIFDDAGFLRP